MIEVLTATAVLVLLVGLLASLLNGALLAWHSSEKRSDGYREARAALQVIGRDLATAWLADEEVNYFMFNPGAGAPIEFSANVVEGSEADGLFFFSLQPGESEVSAVGYFLGRDERDRVNLYRYHLPGEGLVNEWRNAGTGFSAVGPTPPGNSGNSEVLATNVLALEFELLDSGFSPFASSPPYLERPTHVLVRLEVLNARSAELYFQSPNDAALQTGLRTREGRVFNARFALPNP